jgi:hypothetical protein
VLLVRTSFQSPMSGEAPERDRCVAMYGDNKRRYAAFPDISMK